MGEWVIYIPYVQTKVHDTSSLPNNKSYERMMGGWWMHERRGDSGGILVRGFAMVTALGFGFGENDNENENEEDGRFKSERR